MSKKIKIDPMFSIIFFEPYPSHSNLSLCGDVSVIPMSKWSAGSNISNAVMVMSNAKRS